MSKATIKRPWKIVCNTAETVIWQWRDTQSIIVKIERNQNIGQWRGTSHFGNWHFHVPGTRVFRLGAFRSRTAAIKGARAWMKANPDADYVKPLTPAERKAIRKATDAITTGLPLLVKTTYKHLAAAQRKANIQRYGNPDAFKVKK